MQFQGGCQCEAVRYSFDCEPIVAYTCHCTDCQKQSSSAFGISVWFPKDKFALDNGRLAYWNTVTDSGNTKTCAFCRQCGNRIYHALGQEDDVLSVKGGSLDRIAEITPAAHIWMKSAQPWAKTLLTDQVCYYTEPKSFEEIISIYRNK